jgi:hypothetical protein
MNDPCPSCRDLLGVNCGWCASCDVWSRAVVDGYCFLNLDWNGRPMKTAMHTPTLTSTDKRSKTPPFDVLYDGTCSCGGWSMDSKPAATIRAEHMAHLQSLLGPEAQAERMDATKGEPTK